MPNDGDLVDQIAVWVPDEAVRKRILVDNPERLYGFEPPLREAAETASRSAAPRPCSRR